MDFERQIILEEEMVSLGIEQFHRSIDKAKDRKRESTCKYARRMTSVAIQPIADRIDGLIEASKSGKAGRKLSAIKYLEQIDSKVAALITFKSVFDQISKEPKRRSVASAIGKGIEREVRFRRFKEENPQIWQKFTHIIRKSTSDRHTIAAITYLVNENQSDWEEWPTLDRQALGLNLLNLVVQTTGWFEVFRRRIAKKTTSYLRMTPEGQQTIERDVVRTQALNPAYMPMIVRPRPWVDPKRGGYYLHNLPLIKQRSKAYQEEIQNLVPQMRPVYDAINAIQDTAWEINGDVLECLKVFWSEQAQIADLPAQEPALLPAKPVDIDTNVEARKAWRRRASKVYEQNESLKGLRIHVHKMLWLAEKFRDEEAIYFPHQLDFRGRCYPIPLFLQPQGSDLAKGLLRFHESKPIETEEQADWLRIHGSNCWGFDKASFLERVEFIKGMESQIKQWYLDPLTFTGWAEAEEPWQFLAFVFEYGEFLEVGYGFESKLAVGQDGANNGLQNFSAIMRDPVGAYATNLLPSDRPQDIYRVVAEKTMEYVRKDLGKKKYADLWAKFGVDRSTMKRSVMTLPYGATKYSSRGYIQQWVEEQISKGKEDIFGKSLFHACRYLTDLAWKAIAETVIAAREAMDWLQKAARIAAKQGLPIYWTTPAGMPVLQAYPKLKMHRVETMLGGRVTINVGMPTKDLDKSKQASGISPNFIHSMDATHLFMTVNRAVKSGISSFATVHDSFGTHAADSPALARCLREAFVDLYENNTPLEDLRDELEHLLPDDEELPPLPKKGSLDLHQVLESVYFFA